MSVLLKLSPPYLYYIYFGEVSYIYVIEACCEVLLCWDWVLLLHHHCLHSENLPHWTHHLKECSRKGVKIEYNFCCEAISYTIQSFFPDARTMAQTARVQSFQILTLLFINLTKKENKTNHLNVAYAKANQRI